MKLLQDILYKAGIDEVIGSTNLAISQVADNSKNATKGGLYVAIRGTRIDGHQFIDDVIKVGVAAIICEEFPENRPDHITFVKVHDTREALGVIASNFYDNPSEKLQLIGVTGTNGKTTTVTLLFNLFLDLGYDVGLLSTVKNKINTREIDSTHTTPDPLQLNKLLDEMVASKCTHCFMEVSSHAVHQRRIAGLKFKGGVFTNITHDHLDYHETFDAYLAAKKMFFDKLQDDAFALVNKDDKHAAVMVQNTNAEIKTYALKSVADYKCKILENQFSGMLLTVDDKEVWTKLIGSFNAYNILAAYCVANLLNEEPVTILTSLSNLNSVEGRFEYMTNDDGVVGIVDYAHTPDALKNVLVTISDIRTGNEKVITLVGCGGDRDKAKRPLMASIACNGSDKVILTSDNPRSEDPEKIIDEMREGVEPHNFKKVLAISDRQEAIRTACSLASSGDIILVAGKGHETYQEIDGVKHPFDDMKILTETLGIMTK